MTRILVAEDSEALARQLRAELATDGFAVEVAGDGERAFRRGRDEDFAAVVLDLGLPNRDGFSVLRGWREAGRTMPVLILTARDGWTDKVEGLDAGADDYLAKPFAMGELAARLRALIRRSQTTSAPVIERGALRIDTGRHQVTLDGQPVNLTRLEYDLLATLARNAERPLDLAELKRLIYPDGGGGDWNTLAVVASRLRQKLGAGVIETVRGFGYRFGTPGP
jgi:two-component system, OmpR family, response regulator